MFTINCKGKAVHLHQPAVMGIINITPDSFYKGSRAGDSAHYLAKAEQMIAEGAVFLDIGGQSTRPGSTHLAVEEERARVLPAVEQIHQKFPDILISIDTFYASVAKECIAAGAHMVNDISGGQMDEAMMETVSKLQVPYIMMHTKGTPQTMQSLAQYENVTLEVFDYLQARIKQAHEAGIKDVIVDPGFGFAKTTAHNLTLLSRLSYFQNLDVPILVGLSRKATIYKTLNITTEEALNGTTVVNTLALMNGANILRVHDVKEAIQAITLVKAFRQAATTRQ